MTDAPLSPPPSSARDTGSGNRTRRPMRIVLRSAALGLAVIVAGLAFLELRTRGTQGITGITIANFRAEAQADGRPAPPFRMPALNGTGEIGLERYQGDVLVMNFWASWCGPCRTEEPGLVRLARAYRSRGVAFLGIDYRDDAASARAFEREFRVGFPSVFDPAGRLAFAYRLVGIPTTFVIDEHGRIAYRLVGVLQARVLQAAIDDVLAGRAP